MGITQDVRGQFDALGKLTALKNLDGTETPVSGAGKVSSLPAVLHAGDSIAGYGVSAQTIAMSTSQFPFSNSAFSIDVASWGNGTASNGTLTFDKSARALTWAAPGESAGPAIGVSKAGVYVIPSSTATKTLTVICRPRLYSGSTEGAFTVTFNAGTELSRRNGKCAASWIHAKCGAAFDQFFLSNGGSTIADITESLSWQVQPGQYALIHMHQGTNDLSADRTLAQMQADTLAQIDLLKILTPIIVMDTISPRSTSMTAGRRAILHGYNAWLFSLRVPGLRISNTFTPLADPDSATADPLATLLEDGLHPAIRGAEATSEPGYLDISELLAIRGTQLGSSQADIYDATSNPQGNQLTGGGTFTGTGGNVAGAGMGGSLGDNWIISRESGADITAVCSKVARSDGLPGNAQRIVLANPGATSQIVLLQQLNAARPTAASGQTWRARGSLTPVALAGCEYISVSISPDSPGSGRMESQWGSGGSSSVMSGAKRKLTCEPFPHVVPAGATKLQLVLRVRLAAGGSATFDLWPGEWKLWRTA